MTDINKQIEEEAIKYANYTYGCDDDSKGILYNETLKDFKAGAEYILHASRWRKVSEELPDKPCEVLVKDSAACMYIAYFSYGKFILDRYTQINGDIREWKPID